MKLVQLSPQFILAYLTLAAYAAPLKPAMKEIENIVDSNFKPVDDFTSLLSLPERRSVYPVTPSHFNETNGRPIPGVLQISSSKFTSPHKLTFNGYFDFHDTAIGTAVDRRTSDLEAAAPFGEGDGQSFTGVTEGIKLRATSDLIDINVQSGSKNRNHGVAGLLDLRTTDPKEIDPSALEMHDQPVLEEVDALLENTETADADAPVGGLSGIMGRGIPIVGRSVGFSGDLLDGNRDPMAASNLKDSTILTFARALPAYNEA